MDQTTKPEIGSASTELFPPFAPVRDIQQEQKQDSPSPRRKKSLSFHLAFIGLACVNFVFQLDATSIGIAVPTIAHALKGSTMEALFANISYLLCVVASTPIWTSASDAVGRKAALLVAAALFFAGSVVFAVAPNMSTLVAGRAIQGLAGGGIDVLVENALADMTTLRERGFWLGWMGIPIAVGNVLGIPLAGALAQTASWRWLGWLNLPILALGFPLVAAFLRLRSVTRDRSFLDRTRDLDFVGMLLWAGGIVAVVFALGCGGELYPWTSWRILFPLIFGIALLLGFAWHEGHAAFPIAPHRIFRPQTAWLSIVAGFIQGMIMFSVLQYLPLLYQSVALLRVLRMSVLLLPCSLAGVFLSVSIMIGVGARGKGYRWVLVALWIMTAVGTGILTLLVPRSSTAMLIGIPIVWSCGVTSLRLLLLPIQASVRDVDDTNLAIGQLLTFRLFGGVVGLAVGSGTFGSIFSESIAPLRPLVGDLAPLNEPSRAIEFIPELRNANVSGEDLYAVLEVYSKAFRTIFFIMTGLAGLGLATSLLTEELELQKEDLGRQRFEDK